MCRDWSDTLLQQSYKDARCVLSQAKPENGGELTMLRHALLLHVAAPRLGYVVNNGVVLWRDERDTPRAMAKGDGSMARGIFFHIHFCGISHATKGKGAMKSGQVQSLLEVLLPRSQPYLLSKRARRRRFCQNPHVLFTKVNFL
jgi:hypothetical protein